MSAGCSPADATAERRAATWPRESGMPMWWADSEHFNTLLHGAIRDAATLRADLAPLIDRPLDQLSPVEHAALLIGAFELKHHIEIPYKVVINEAVELTKSFGGIDGHKYVNGVLDRFAANVRQVEVDAGRK